MTDLLLFDFAAFAAVIKIGLIFFYIGDQGSIGPRKAPNAFSFQLYRQ